MSDVPPSFHGPLRWMPMAFLVLLLSQIGLTWVQGRLLHQQKREIKLLREDIQLLVEALEQGNTLEGDLGNGSVIPNAFFPVPNQFRRGGALRVRHQEGQGEEPVRDLEATRRSAQEAVKEARDVQQTLSLEVNAQKAAEKEKLNAAQHTGIKWMAMALGVLVMVLLGRAWQKRRA